MINGIDYIGNNTLSQIGQKDKELHTGKTSDSLFEGALDAAKGLLQATNEAEHAGTQLTNDFIMGKTDDVASLMIAQEKSSILLSFTMQVRNQVMTAYQEIMRISV